MINKIEKIILAAEELGFETISVEVGTAFQSSLNEIFDQEYNISGMMGVFKSNHGKMDFLLNEEIDPNSFIISFKK